MFQKEQFAIRITVPEKFNSDEQYGNKQVIDKGTVLREDCEVAAMYIWTF